MITSKSRLRALSALLTQIHKSLGLEIGFRMWDGSSIPADWPANALALHLADEGAFAGLLKKPNFVTVANLWVAKRLDILNGSIFDLVAKRPKTRSRELWKSISKLRTLRAALPYLLVSRGGPWPLEAIDQDKVSDGSVGQNAKNISYHYDVSNAFYELWLDKEMLYTCAYCHDWDDSLEKMQMQKLEMACRRLRLKPGESFLDLGCGWGALAIYAAQNFGVTAYAVTLSEQQVIYGNEKIKRLGLEGRVTIELKDALQVDGAARFDKASSLGLQEHIGLVNHARFFSNIHRLLKPGGLYLNHAITRPGKSEAARTGRARPEFEALTRYIFPGGDLDYIGRTITNLELAGFEIHDVEAWREHYQRTCRLWHDRLLANYEASCKEVGEVKTRLWLAYLAACSITFERNNCGLYQTLCSKRVRGPSGVPPTRADLYR